MGAPKNNNINEDQLLYSRQHQALTDQDEVSLIRLAEFFSAEGMAQVGEADAVLQPKPLLHPEHETVFEAVRRLGNTYYMVDRSRLRNQAYALLGTYLINGRPSNEVIADLEALFARAYQDYRVAVEK